MVRQLCKVGFAYDKRVGEVRYTIINDEIWLSLNFVSRILGFHPSVAWKELHNDKTLEIFFGPDRRPTIAGKIRAETLDGDVDVLEVSLTGVWILCAISDRVDSHEIYRVLGKDLALRILAANKSERAGKQSSAKHNSKATHTTEHSRTDGSPPVARNSGRKRASEGGRPAGGAKFSPEALRRLLEDIYAEAEQEGEKDQS